MTQEVNQQKLLMTCLQFSLHTKFNIQHTIEDAYQWHIWNFGNFQTAAATIVNLRLLENFNLIILGIMR